MPEDLASAPAPAIPSKLPFPSSRARALRKALIAIAVLVALVVIDRSGLLQVKTSDVAKYDHRQFVVSNVVDGDTLDVAAPDGEHATTRIRFWGIDCPEMDHPTLPGPAGTKPRQPFALEATEMTRNLALGKTVTLYLEPQRPRDKFGRLLAHLELPDKTLLNEDLLAAGLAKADNRWSHRWNDRFTLLEQQAKHDHVGLWQKHSRNEPAEPPEE